MSESVPPDGTEQGKRMVYLGKPPRPISQMTDEELDAWLATIVDTARENINRDEGDVPESP